MELIWQIYLMIGIICMIGSLINTTINPYFNLGTKDDDFSVKITVVLITTLALILFGLLWLPLMFIKDSALREEFANVGMKGSDA